MRAMTPQTVNAVNMPAMKRAQLSCRHPAAALPRRQADAGGVRFTGDQQLFLSFAQIWRTKFRSWLCGDSR